MKYLRRIPKRPDKEEERGEKKSRRPHTPVKWPKSSHDDSFSIEQGFPTATVKHPPPPTSSGVNLDSVDQKQWILKKKITWPETATLSSTINGNKIFFLSLNTFMFLTHWIFFIFKYVYVINSFNFCKSLNMFVFLTHWILLLSLNKFMFLTHWIFFGVATTNFLYFLKLLK